MSRYLSLNPATETLIREYPEHSWKDAEGLARKAFEAHKTWRETPFKARAELMKKAAAVLRGKKDECANLMTEEMGKPIVQAEAEVEKCAWGAEHYAAKAESFLKEELIPADAGKSYMRYDPLGVILGIMPWNFPFWQIFRFAIPTLMAGNAVLVKPAPNTPGCSLAAESICREVGFPDGLFQTVFLSNEDTARLIGLPQVQGVSLTGSSRAGREVASVAGQHLKRSVLELGGSDPFVVFDDADLGKTIPLAVRSRMLNAGQSCIAAKRFIIAKKIFSKFEKGLKQAFENLKVGNPKDRHVDLGPLAREDLLANLERQVAASISDGARLTLGGKRIEGRGYFYPPTILEDVRPGMTSFEEETFGPVASLIAAKDDEEAVALANQTSYGLGASLWTADTKRAEELARVIEAGSVFINGMVKSDPRLPFGGIKNSGYGRELSAVGIREFVNIKTVWVAS